MGLWDISIPRPTAPIGHIEGPDATAVIPRQANVWRAMSPPMGRRVVVTGLGVASAAGLDVPSFWGSLLAGRSGTSRVEALEGKAPPVPYVAQVEESALNEACASLGVRKVDRVTRLAALAAQQAWTDAGLLSPGEGPEAPLPRRAGVILGSGLGGLMFQEEQMWKVLRSGQDRIHPHSVPRISPTALVTELALRFGLRGPGFVVSSACASAAHAIGQAFRSIQHGESDLIITGGAEAPLSHFTLTAFSLLGVLARKPGDPARAGRPFDVDRDGFVLGEGAGVLVLEELEHARRRGASIHGELCGFGQSLGAHHAVAVRPDGEDAADAMRAALEDARLPPQAIGYVNAHGTGTLDNDAVEARALHAVFGPAARTLAVSSIKGATGHSLGAAGGLEAIATILALAQGRLPPSANCHNPDPACEVDVVVGEARPAGIQYALSNSFGFGNINVALAFGRYSDDS